MAEFRAALKLQPDDALAHYNLGNALMDQGKRAEAMAAFRAALKFQPDLAEAHNNLGRVLDAQGEPAEAMAAFRAALKLQPDLAEAHNNLGHVLTSQGKLAEAVAEFRAALKLKPDHTEAHYNPLLPARPPPQSPPFNASLEPCATRARSRPRKASSEAEFRAALRLQPDLAEAHNNLGLVLHAQGRPAEAEAEFRAAPEAPSPTRPPLAHYNIPAWSCTPTGTEADPGPRPRPNSARP